MFNKSIVVITAHPDDAEVACGGTLALLKNCGYKITIVTMTAGGMGGINMSEQETVKIRRERMF